MHFSQKVPKTAACEKTGTYFCMKTQTYISKSSVYTIFRIRRSIGHECISTMKIRKTIPSNITQV
jgi:hypothetical protein